MDVSIRKREHEHLIRIATLIFDLPTIMIGQMRMFNRSQPAPAD